MLAERFHNPPNAVIELHDGIAANSTFTLAGELFCRGMGNMNVAWREVQEEWVLFVPFDELTRFVWPTAPDAEVPVLATSAYALMTAVVGLSSLKQKVC